MSSGDVYLVVGGNRGEVANARKRLIEENKELSHLILLPNDRNHVFYDSVDRQFNEVFDQARAERDTRVKDFENILQNGPDEWVRARLTVGRGSDTDTVTSEFKFVWYDNPYRKSALSRAGTVYEFDKIKDVRVL